MSAPCVPRMMRRNFCSHRSTRLSSAIWLFADQTSVKRRDYAGRGKKVRYFVGIGNAAVAAGEDDGDGGRDEGVGAPDDGGEARAEEALNQRVDPGDEQQRLDHPRLLLLPAKKEESAKLSCQAPARRWRGKRQ